MSFVCCHFIQKTVNVTMKSHSVMLYRSELTESEILPLQIYYFTSQWR